MKDNLTWVAMAPRPDKDGVVWTLEVIQQKLREHIEQHPRPKHGIQCICMDEFVWAMERLMGFKRPRPANGDWDQLPYSEIQKAPEDEYNDRMLHILRMVSRTDLL